MGAGIMPERCRSPLLMERLSLFQVISLSLQTANFEAFNGSPYPHQSKRQKQKVETTNARVEGQPGTRILLLEQTPHQMSANTSSILREKCDGNCIYQSCFSVSSRFKKDGRIGRNCVCLHYAVIVSIFHPKNKAREICVSYFILNCQTFPYIHKRPSCFGCRRQWQFEWKLKPLLSSILSGRRFKNWIRDVPIGGSRLRIALRWRQKQERTWEKRRRCFMCASSPCRGDTI